MAYAAGRGADDDAGRWVVTVAAGAIAVWLATMAFRALR
jgi:hypothetical protein